MYQRNKSFYLLSIPTGLLTILLTMTSLPGVAVSLSQEETALENAPHLVKSTTSFSTHKSSDDSQYERNKNNIHTNNPANGRIDSNR